MGVVITDTTGTGGVVEVEDNVVSAIGEVVVSDTEAGTSSVSNTVVVRGSVVVVAVSRSLVTVSVMGLVRINPVSSSERVPAICLLWWARTAARLKCRGLGAIILERLLNECLRAFR